jgi:hypothetical protein
MTKTSSIASDIETSNQIIVGSYVDRIVQKIHRIELSDTEHIERFFAVGLVMWEIIKLSYVLLFCKETPISVL